MLLGICSNSHTLFLLNTYLLTHLPVVTFYRMNSKHFIVSSIVFLIEARKYDVAASYLLHDIYQFENINAGSKGRQSLIEGLTGALRKCHGAVRAQYPDRLTLVQMREIAREAYEQVRRSLLNGEYSSSLAYSENSGIN